MSQVNSHTDQPRSEVQNRKAETQGNRNLVPVSERVPDTPTQGRLPGIMRPRLRDSEKVDRCREKLRDGRYTFLMK